MELPDFTTGQWIALPFLVILGGWIVLRVWRMFGEGPGS